jgi:hypothetical protein
MSWHVVGRLQVVLLRIAFAAVLGGLCLPSSFNAEAKADFIDPQFSGDTSYDAWTLPGLSAASNPGYPTSANYTDLWPAPIGSTLGADAQLEKLSGGGYPLAEGSGGGIYTFFAGGSFSISDSSAVAGLQTVLLQLELPSNPTTAGPVLNYNAGSQALVPTTALDVGAGFSLYQWDLMGVGGSITDFNIGFELGLQHSQIAGIRLDQSSVMTTVPEPMSGVLLAIGGAAVLLGRRKFYES